MSQRVSRGLGKQIFESTPGCPPSHIHTAVNAESTIFIVTSTTYDVRDSSPYRFGRHRPPSRRARGDIGRVHCPVPSVLYPFLVAARCLRELSNFKTLERPRDRSVNSHPTMKLFAGRRETVVNEKREAMSTYNKLRNEQRGH